MSASDTEYLQEIAEGEIERLKQLSPPIVRVCGPLTMDGEEGYERHSKRLLTAEKILESQGKTVWSYADSEKKIVGRNFSHEHIMRYFHEPLLRSGIFAAAYFLKDWQKSTGATLEHSLCKEANIEIKEFPESWFTATF